MFMITMNITINEYVDKTHNVRQAVTILFKLLACMLVEISANQILTSITY